MQNISLQWESLLCLAPKENQHKKKWTAHLIMTLKGEWKHACAKSTQVSPHLGPPPCLVFQILAVFNDAKSSYSKINFHLFLAVIEIMTRAVCAPSVYLGKVYYALAYSCARQPNCTIYSKKKKGGVGGGGGVGNNEVLKAVICVHSLAHLSAVDRGATKGNTSLWFMVTEIFSNTSLLSPWNKRHMGEKWNTTRTQRHSYQRKSAETTHSGKKKPQPKQGQGVASQSRNSAANIQGVTNHFILNHNASYAKHTSITFTHLFSFFGQG